MEYVEEQGPLLESLVYLNQAQVIVEVGVAEAKSTDWLCRGAKLRGGKVYGYDLWDTHGLKNQFEHWSSKEKCEEYLQSKGHVNFELTKINSRTPEFAELIKTKHPSIDLAYIDGCHSYDGLKNDFDINPIQDSNIKTFKVKTINNFVDLLNNKSFLKYKSYNSGKIYAKNFFTSYNKKKIINLI
jgi:hypothetical protein